MIDSCLQKSLDPRYREEAIIGSKGEDREQMLFQNALADALNDSEWAFPLEECVHIGGFAIAVGSITLVDFRMLNLGLRDASAARILRYTELWTVVALIFVLFSGFMLFISQVGIYLINPIFPIKMYVLAAAVIYNFTIHRKVATMENPPVALSRLVAAVSLLLWVAVVFGGIFTGFLE
jgi:hypothetical protein